MSSQVKPVQLQLIDPSFPPELFVRMDDDGEGSFYPIASEVQDDAFDDQFEETSIGRYTLVETYKIKRSIQRVEP